MFKLVSAIVAAATVGAGSGAQACDENCHGPCRCITTTAPREAKHVHEETARGALEQLPQVAREPGRQTYRSFSYEPGMTTEATRTYVTRRMSPSLRTRTPAYLLPKSDPRRHSVR